MSDQEKVRTSVYFDRVKGEFVRLDAALIDQLKRDHPGVNVEREIARMVPWLLSPKGKSTVGTIAFISNWLRRSPVTQSMSIEVDLPPELRNYISEYVWKGREHLLAMNQRQMS